MKIRKSAVSGAGATLFALALWVPTAAQATTTGPIDVVDETESPVTLAPMTIDCETFSESDRQRAIIEGINLCGALSGDGSTNAEKAQTVGDCGVSSIYVDRNSGGNLRISYGLHSTAGPIIARSVTATWGPFDTGSNYDLGPVGQESYSNSLTGASVPRGAIGGGTLRGSVTIAGWTFTCDIVADDPVHPLNP
ncbi:hypothetical protein AB0E56_06865 [Microbacterium sp. NPDC028030]|uniref:hypothetical protein n=1 Tax=Microbacterium sp. NPDC028030 TaxID=3155124 RepID=UPI0033E184A6